MEPERDTFLKTLAAAGRASISAGSWVEVGTVVARRFRALDPELPARLLRAAQISIEPVSAEQASIAHRAYRAYGIGAGGTPCLNFGDCFAYALAKETGEPLLFKGDDFIHTDIVPAL